MKLKRAGDEAKFAELVTQLKQAHIKAQAGLDAVLWGKAAMGPEAFEVWLQAHIPRHMIAPFRGLLRERELERELEREEKGLAE
jgi:hypothetical protein